MNNKTLIDFGLKLEKYPKKRGLHHKLLINNKKNYKKEYKNILKSNKTDVLLKKILNEIPLENRDAHNIKNYTQKKISENAKSGIKKNSKQTNLSNFIVFENSINLNQTLDKYSPFENLNYQKRKNINPSKVLIIVSCTKKKLDRPAPAIELYQGDIFKKTKKWVEINNFHQIIISARYGIVEPHEIIKPYDKRLSNKKEAEKLQRKIIPKLRKILPNYKLVVLILGNIYLEAIKPIFKEFSNIPYLRLKAKRGLIDYKKNLIRLLNNDKSVLQYFAGQYNLSIIEDFMN
ncbi:MAG: DUF6884 domain-containing protein [Promethearchaeota archaeon]